MASTSFCTSSSHVPSTEQGWLNSNRRSVVTRYRLKQGSAARNMQALDLCLLGRECEADSLLGLLGVKLRLGPALLHPAQVRLFVDVWAVSAEFSVHASVRSCGKSIHAHTEGVRLQDRTSEPSVARNTASDDAVQPLLLGFDDVLPGTVTVSAGSFACLLCRLGPGASAAPCPHDTCPRKWPTCQQLSL